MRPASGATSAWPGHNAMQAGPGSGYMPALTLEFLTEPFFFNEPNLAYLQGRLVVLP